MLFMSAIFDFWDLQGPKMAQNGPKLLRKPQVVLLGHFRAIFGPWRSQKSQIALMNNMVETVCKKN